ncbi:MAG TPA: Fic family protein [Thermoanaerobaculia bacterium]|nr:Fic family protein [Thermoanaerobaculia bacterium]
MADWDDDTPRLRSNLAKVFDRARDEALSREPLTIEVARGWQLDIMQGLIPPDSKLVGRFRGEAGLENYNVRVGDLPGVRASEVLGELAEFDRKLRLAIAELDQLIKPGQDLTSDDLAAVLTLGAWAHSEWVRIHPFANGNGRTARLWANSIAMRYGLPPFLRLRPRPGSGYDRAAAAAMRGDWRPTVSLLRQMYIESLRA